MNRKPYVRYTILGISLLLSLLCVIRIAMPNREWNYAGSYEFVKGFPVLSKGFEIETEMTIHAVDKNFKLVEIPVTYRDRPEGSVSKLNT